MVHNRAPRLHQLQALAKTADLRAAALFMEQRTGKTLVAIKTAAFHASSSAIDAALIIGWPNGVQHVWNEEWPKDWPTEMPYRAVTWRSGKMRNDELTTIVAAPEFVAVFMNCEALLTDVAWKFIGKLISKRRLLVIVDEDWAKNPGAARTKRLLAIGRHPNAVYRRFLSGTPAAEGSLDLWAPCAFLDWRLLGHKSFFTFRNRYAVMTTGYGPGGREFKTQATDPRSGAKLYQNLDELRGKLDAFSFRVRRADVSDAPPKTYVTRYFDLTAKQRRVYERLNTEYEVELSRGTLPISLQITRLLRLQMISRGYYPPEMVGAPCVCMGVDPECDACQGLGVVPTRTHLERIDERNPALEALSAELEANPGPLLVWARFRQDVTDIISVAANLGRVVNRYDGTVPATTREASYRKFQTGECDLLVATISSGLSRGHDCSRAEAMIYYSNSYVLRDRLQSEDRAESLTRTASTGVIDLVGVDTRDGPIIEALRSKREVAAYLQGDPMTRSF